MDFFQHFIVWRTDLYGRALGACCNITNLRHHSFLLFEVMWCPWESNLSFLTFDLPDYDIYRWFHLTTSDWNIGFVELKRVDPRELFRGVRLSHLPERVLPSRLAHLRRWCECCGLVGRFVLYTFHRYESILSEITLATLSLKCKGNILWVLPPNFS